MTMEDVSNEPVAEQVSKITSIRTVEFRQALRGYNIDDVDEYLEQLAVEADAVFEQIRQLTEQLSHANARVSQLESGAAVQMQEASGQVAAAAGALNDSTVESLQNTLILAQKFVDQTHAEAQEQARSVIAAAESQAKKLLEKADVEAKRMLAETEGRAKQEVARLEQVRSKLAGEVEAVARYLDGERTRLRGALTEMVAWVDEQFNPAAAVLSQPADQSGSPGRDDGLRDDTGNDGTRSNGVGSNGTHGDGDDVGGIGTSAADLAGRSTATAVSDFDDPLNLFS
ncbi:MAG: DivIVA domain-containing protein [Actinobacteria bacterium]|nr:DivIVA domain-containing protein [Actinomycetota bacterium]